MKLMANWKQIVNPTCRLVIALTMFLCEGLPASGADATPYLGQWASITLEGAGPVGGNAGCQIVAWTDREVKLDPISGNPSRVRGEWVRSYQALWVAANSDQCRFPGETKFEPTHIAVIGWTVTGGIDPSSGRLRISASYRECNGGVCGMMQASQRDFQTELAIVNGELVDADPSQKPEDHRAFIPKSAEAARTAEALKSLKPLLGFVDAGNVDRLYDESASVAKSAVSRDQMRVSFADLRSRTGPALSRAVMQTMYAIYGPNNDMHRKELAIIVNNIYFKQNQSGLEYSVLEKEGGEWKMAWYYIGGRPSPPQ